MPIWWLELVIGLYDSFFYFCEAFFCAHWSVFWHACSIVLTHTNLCKKVYAIHISKGSQKVTHESMSTPCHKRALKPLFKFWKKLLLCDAINSYIIEIDSSETHFGFTKFESKVHRNWVLSSRNWWIGSGTPYRCLSLSLHVKPQIIIGYDIHISSSFHA